MLIKIEILTKIEIFGKKMKLVTKIGNFDKIEILVQDLYFGQKVKLPSKMR